MFAFADLLIIAAAPVVTKAWQSSTPLWVFTTFTLVPSAIFLFCLKPRQVRTWFRRDVFFLLLANALFGSFATFILFFTALQYTTATNAALVEQVEIVYSLAIAVVFLRERISLQQLVGTVMITATVASILIRPGFSFNKGELMMLAVPLGFQTGHAIAKRLLTRIDAVEMAAGRQVFSTVLICSFAAAVGRSDFDGQWQWRRMLALAGIGMIVHAANSLVWFAALKRMNLSKATAIVMAYPVLTAVFEWAATGAPLPPRTVIALALMIVALAVLVTSPARPASA